MASGIGWGLALVVLGGLLQGSFAAPMKRIRGWRWENTWLIYCISGLIVIPWIIAAVTVPHLSSVYQESSWPALGKVTIFGFGWGVGATLFGLGISRVGLALGFAVILGITSTFGSLLPLLILHPDQLPSRQGLALVAGTLVMIVGLIFLGVAGRHRERETGGTAGAPRGGFGVGLVICIISGVLSPMLNFAFLFGSELKERALAAGASLAMSSNPIWSLAVTTGFVANAVYCIYLLQTNHTWRAFSASGTPGYWLGSSLMGLLWFGGIVVYGMGAVALGSLGGIVGWPVFMAINISAGYFWGVATGEWKGASRRSFSYSWIGIIILLVSIYVISLGNVG